MPSDASRAPAAPIRVTLLTGFLGAGKTTLLNRLLADPGVTGTAVIVNEFGAVGIDHLLVETATDGVIELSGGCLCCSVRGDLADTLADLVDRMQTGRIAPLRRIVIETTGLADPTPILGLMMAHPVFLQAFALDGVVTVVDALTGARSLDERLEARRQVAVADRLVLTKTDLADPADRHELAARLAALNPNAPVLDAAGDIARPDRLFDCGPFDPARIAEIGAAGDRHRHHHHAHHRHHGETAGIRSFVLEHDRPIGTGVLRQFLDVLASGFGSALLRVKGLALTADAPERPVVVHGVRGFVHPTARLAAWPPGMPPATRLVVIGENLDAARLADLFAAFTGGARIDAPDRAALTENPLAIAGFGQRR